MSVKILTEHHLEFLSFKEGCTDSSGSTLIKMQHCWKSQTHILNSTQDYFIKNNTGEQRIFVHIRLGFPDPRCLHNKVWM